jgi:uncharacterized protein (TIGR02117 family)
MKKAITYSFRTLLGVIIFLVLYVTVAWSLQQFVVEREYPADDPSVVEIFIKTNGVHTDFVVPVRNQQIDWSKHVLFANTVSKDTTFNYLALGWGDKGFYLNTPEWKDLKASTALKAAFGLSTTAMHATFYRQMNESETCRKIAVTAPEYQRLIKYIDESFEHNADGSYQYINTTANYGQNDAFYEAKGRYTLFYTCNTWTNQALKSCGQRAALWTLTDKGIFDKYK